MKRRLLLLALSLFAGQAIASPPMTLRAYELGWARYYASADHVPEELVEAIMIVESSGDPYAVSPKGAAGVMQLMPATAYQFRIRNRFIIEENIRAGVAYLGSLLREFHGDPRLAGAAYYAGPKRVERRKLACSSPEIYNYVSRAAALYRELRERRR